MVQIAVWDGLRVGGLDWLIDIKVWMYRLGVGARLFVSTRGVRGVKLERGISSLDAFCSGHFHL